LAVFASKSTYPVNSYEENVFMQRVLVINPGNTSTKYAVYDDERVMSKKTVEHHGEVLHRFARVFDQRSYRLKIITDALAQAHIPLKSLNAVVGRGGLLRAVPGGTYLVNELMLRDLERAERGEHASNLGGALAYDVARPIGIPAFIVDPVSVDELQPVARITGSPEFERISLCHALNMKAVGRKVAAEMCRQYNEVTFVVAHLGSGVSMSLQRGGKNIDICDGQQEGMFSADRSGALPTQQLVSLCYSGKYTERELKRKLMGQGGLYAYLGTADIRAIEKMASEGDDKAELLLQAFAYQVAKEIGALSTVVSGNVDRVVLTGGIAYSNRIVQDITVRVQFIAPVVVIPGEEELDALNAGALRVLREQEEARTYREIN
jgi:butyrate kinase